MDKKVFLYPILILLSVFLIDKITLIPFIQKYGRSEATPLENIREGMKRIYKNNENSQKTETHQKHIVFFGSSRTEALRNLTKASINKTPYLNQDEKEQLLEYKMEMRGSAKASDLLYNYLLIKDLLESSYKPSKIFFEISPEMYNQNSPYHASYHFQTNIFSYSELLDFQSIAEENWKMSVLTSILFPSSHYKFSWVSFLKKSLKNQDYLNGNSVVEFFPQLPSVYTIENSEDIHESIAQGKDYDSRIKGYTNYMTQDFIAKDFTYSSSEAKLFQRVIHLAKESDIPILFWKPRTHRYYQSELSKIGIGDIETEIQSQLESANLPYMNLENVEMKCNFFTDSSHLSPRCAPEAIYHLIHESQPNNP